MNRFFPSHCISCWKQGNYLCKSCKKNLLPHPEICPLCHRFSANYETCINCKSNKERYLEGIIIPFSYGAAIKKLILKLKYGHKKDVVNFLTDRLILALQLNQKMNLHFEIPPVKGEHWANAKQGGLKPELVISFVPSHRYRKYFTKWYNQSELLAKNLASKLWVTCISITKKNKHTKSQAGLKRQDRIKNLHQAFCIKKNINLTGNETVVLIDDVATTWSTLNQIAKTIKTTYPKAKIRGLVIARHIG